MKKYWKEKFGSERWKIRKQKEERGLKVVLDGQSCWSIMAQGLDTHHKRRLEPLTVFFFTRTSKLCRKVSHFQFVRRYSFWHRIPSMRISMEKDLPFMINWSSWTCHVMSCHHGHVHQQRLTPLETFSFMIILDMSCHVILDKDLPPWRRFPSWSSWTCPRFWCWAKAGTVEGLTSAEERLSSPWTRSSSSRVPLADASTPSSRTVEQSSKGWRPEKRKTNEILYCIINIYRVIHKKLSHKTEDKMQEKMKMILQVDENLAHL